MTTDYNFNWDNLSKQPSMSSVDEIFGDLTPPKQGKPSPEAIQWMKEKYPGLFPVWPQTN